MGDTETAGKGARAQEGVTERKRQRKMGPRRQRQTEHTQVRNRVREMQAKRQTDRGERNKVCVRGVHEPNREAETEIQAEYRKEKMGGEKKGGEGKAGRKRGGWEGVGGRDKKDRQTDMFGEMEGTKITH